MVEGTVMTSQRDVEAPGYKLFAQEWRNPRPKSAIERIVISLGPDATDEGAVIIPAISLIV
jgi:hypothetical protein